MNIKVYDGLNPQKEENTIYCRIVKHENLSVIAVCDGISGEVVKNGCIVAFNHSTSNFERFKNINPELGLTLNNDGSIKISS